MQRSVVFISVIAMSLTLASQLVPSVSFAQGGSTGGSLGKSGQELSGERPKQAAPDKESKGESAKAKPATLSVSGRWKWDAKCDDGSLWNGEFQFDHRPDGTLRGMCSTSATWGCGDVSGHVFGTTATFTVFWSDPLGGHRNPFTFSITDGGRAMRGSEQSVAHGRCSYQARRS